VDIQIYPVLFFFFIPCFICLSSSKSMDEMILLTGGTGLLGSHLLLSLVKEQKELIALKRPSSDLEEVRRVFSYYISGEDELTELFGRIRWVDADLLNQAEMEEVFEGVERVYHCAATVSFQPRDRKKIIRFNTDSTACVVSACLAAGVKKLLHVSSTSAIGRSPEGSPASEALIWSHSKTSTAYAESKFRSEMEVWRGIEEGLNAVIVNPSIILGAGFWERGSSSMFSRVAGGLKYAAPGITGYVGVQDVVSAMIRLMNSDISGERFILSEGDYSYAQVFGMIGQSMGISRNLKLVTPWAAFGESHFSSEKIKSAIGMEFIPLDQVIGEVAEQYRLDHPQ